MIVQDASAFADTLPPMSALAGLDLGTVTIGVAISDRLRGVATPVETIKRKKFGVDAAALLELLTKREVGGIVLGLPMNMDGSEGPRCQATRAFARNLEKLTDLPMTFWDERLSTVAAERALLAADTSRKRIKICTIHPASRTCTGCLRTIDEIGAWSRMSPEARRAVMAQLEDRKAQLTKRRGGRAARLAKRD